MRKGVIHMEIIHWVISIFNRPTKIKPIVNDNKQKISFTIWKLFIGLYQYLIDQPK
jgi:hypothetical protein